MITIATERDINRALGLANGFAGKPVDEATFIEWWRKAITNGLATVFTRTGSDDQLKEAIGVLVFKSPFDGAKTAAVSFWYTDQSEGTTMASGILFRRAEEFLKETGVKTLHCSAIFDGNFEKVDTFLKRSGFKPHEMQYSKTL